MALLITSLLVTAADARERRTPPDAAPSAAVRFDHPDQWRCGPDGACVRCASLAERAGLTFESRGTAPRHVEVPAHGAIRICPP